MPGVLPCPIQRNDDCVHTEQKVSTGSAPSCGNYLIIYEIRDQDRHVEILRFIHGARVL